MTMDIKKTIDQDKYCEMTKNVMEAFRANVVPPNIPETQTENFLSHLSRYETVLLELARATDEMTRDDLFFSRDLFIFGSEIPMYWDMAEFKKAIKKKHVLEKNIPLQNLKDALLYQAFDEDKLIKFMESGTVKPIYTAKVPFIQGGLVIVDGNHRAKAAINKGRRTIKGYELNEDQFLDTMPEFSSALYKVISNISNTFGYHRGLVDFGTYMDKLYIV